MTPTVNGYELSIGDDLGTETIPDCCDEDMTAGAASNGYRNYTCSECNTVLTVAPTGLVYDIRP
ncbi:hypothetical protein [Streptomyces sp. 5-6(2022)]|uniref:hypothetical protein n=1 Tax=Streptomyces sp. 5-6(2022) TaxID=2936510 RepID=UPI0023B9E0EC|nr:hypothetical protein [Streptomyces sp. 5-6(2022)]